jgi:rare lipoprotein A
MPRRALVAAILLVVSALLSAARTADAGSSQGMASYYATGLRTASGEPFDPQAHTAAHRSLPFGTRVEVKCQRTGRSLVVRINDRGPFIAERIIDLTLGAAVALGLRKTGIGPVIVTVLNRLALDPP